MELTSKTVLIVGATGGIGREITQEIAKCGANLLLLARNEEELSILVETAKKSGAKNVYHFVCDLSDPESVNLVIGKLKKSFTKLDLLINAAGIGIYKSIEDTTLTDWKNSMDVNITSVFLFIKELLPDLAKSENGLVINLGSGMGTIPTAGRSLYCATKFALRGLSLSLSEEFKSGKPIFCLITLGSTLTEFGPMTLEEKKKEMGEGKAYFTPDWVAKKIVEIIKSDRIESEYILYPADYADRNK